MIPFDEQEPWMQAVDPAGNGEYRVQFDTDTFWKGMHDEELKLIREENDLIPKTGYFSCREFMKEPNRNFGVKRYTIFKPDGTRSTITQHVKMKHVLPLM